MLVEGESDCHTLWHHRIPAVGLPGAGNWREDRDAPRLHQLPQQARDTFVANAPTYLGELRDPDALRADLDSLARSAVPVLLSQGDQSPAMFVPILDRVAAALPNAKRTTIAGAGHIPHMTHPKEYAAVIRGFLLAT